MKKTYFASDFHLGAMGNTTSEERERKIVRWLRSIASDAEALYLVGDVFDFWFEYRTVIPKGYTRLLGTLAELRDGGLPIYFFTGNHDIWAFRYFTDELGIPIYREPIIQEIYGKKFFIGHGDGLGPKDYGYKRLKKVFTNPMCQWLFSWLHPDIGVGVANYFSKKSRYSQDENEIATFLGEDNEWLLQYADRKLETVAADYFIFGHRHLPIDWTLKNEKSRYINLGEWLNYSSFAVFDGEDISLQFFENDKKHFFTNRPALL